MTHEIIILASLKETVVSPGEWCFYFPKAKWLDLSRIKNFPIRWGTKEREGGIYNQTCFIHSEFSVLFLHVISNRALAVDSFCFRCLIEATFPRSLGWKIFLRKASVGFFFLLIINPKLDAVSLNFLWTNQLASRDCFIVVFSMCRALSKSKLSFEINRAWSEGRLLGGAKGVAVQRVFGRSGNGRMFFNSFSLPRTWSGSRSQLNRTVSSLRSLSW